MGWRQMTADAVIYGAGVQGMAAAAKFLADTKRAGKTLCIIDPEVPRTANGMDGIGTIATLGGQNYWDCMLADSNIKSSYQGGTFRDLYGYYQKYNNTLAFRDALWNYVLESGGGDERVTILHQMDLKQVTIDANDKITSVYLESVAREFSQNGDGAVQFSHLETISLDAKVFIDASESGKLSRMAQKNIPPHKDSTAVTTGRYDWDSGYLFSNEMLGDGIGRQQAVTLMVKLKGIDRTAIYNKGAELAKIDLDKGDDGTWGMDASAFPYSDAAGRIAAFNNAHLPEGYMIKPFNAAMNGPQEGIDETDQEWWFNTFLIFHVDGRAYERDRGTDLYPTMKFNYKNVDEAWKGARQFLKDHETEFLDALKDWTGLTLGESDLAFVKDEYGYPEVGDMLYVRETCHTSNQDTNTANGGEETSYHVAWWESMNAGNGPDNGGDTGNYAHRIGLVWYNPDIHPYTPADMKDPNGKYIWGYKSYQKMRDNIQIPDGSPAHPMYYPYEGILNYQVSNLLVPGYAANCCSFSWGEVRVLSNLCVLGDAAGLAAGYCVRSTDNLQPRDIATSNAHMAELQNSLRSYEIPLEKGKENAIVRENPEAAAQSAQAPLSASVSAAALSAGVPSYVTNGLMGLYYNIGESKARNSQTNKMTLYDKSGNGRNLTFNALSQMNGSDSGWVKDALRCSREYPTTTLRYTMPSNIYTMEVLIKRKNMPEAEQKPISCAEFNTDIKVTKGFTFGQDWVANSTEFSVSFAGERFVTLPNTAGKYPFDEVVSVSVSFNPSDKSFYCYVNGEFLGKVLAAGHIPTNQFRLGNFGMNRDGGYGCFTGDIYCARIYNRYLPQDEVLANYYRDREVMKNLVSDDVVFSLDFDSFTDISNHENTVTNNLVEAKPTGSVLKGAGYLPVLKTVGDFTKSSDSETISTFKYCRWTGSSELAITGDFTMECWVYPTGESMSLLRAGLFMSSSSLGTHSFGLGLYRTGELSFEGEFSGSGKVKLVSGAGEVPLGRWSHVAAVRWNDSLILYVNGRKVAETAVSGSRVTYADEGDFFIGRAGNYGSSSAMKIRDTKFYGFMGKQNFLDYAKYTKDFSKLIAPCLSGRYTYRMKRI